MTDHKTGAGILGCHRPLGGSARRRDRPALEEPGDDEEQHGEGEHDADRRVESKHADRLELAHHQRHKPHRRGACREGAGEPAQADRAPGDPIEPAVGERVDEVVGEVDSPRDAKREDEHRHDDEDRVHPVAPGGEPPEVEPDTGQRHEKDEQGIAEAAQRPPGEEEDDQRPRAPKPKKALHARFVDRDVVDDRAGEVELALRERRDPRERLADPGDGGAAVGEPDAREGDHQAGRPVVGADQHPAEPSRGLLAGERQRRIGELGQRHAAAGDRLKPRLAPRVLGALGAGCRSEEGVDRRGIERAAVPRRDHDVATLELAGELLVGRPRGERHRHPLHRRRGVDLEHAERRRHHPWGDGQKAEDRHQAHREEPGGPPAA